MLSERSRLSITPFFSMHIYATRPKYMDEFQALALASPLIRDVVDSLQRIVQARDDDPDQGKKDLVSRHMRDQARGLLQKLFALLIPPVKKLSFQEQTLNGNVLRGNMLGMYEYEHARLARILGDRRIRASITASATLHPLSLAHGASRWTEGSRRYLDGRQYRGKHRPGLLPEKSLRRSRAVRTCEQEVVHRGEARTLSGVLQSS
jgi:hypothetical protein